MNFAPARTRATRWGAFTACQRAWAYSTSLNAMARFARRAVSVMLKGGTPASRQNRMARRSVSSALKMCLPCRSSCFGVAVGGQPGGELLRGAYIVVEDRVIDLQAADPVGVAG